MHANAELITRFYTALSRLDGAAMAACYADDATFSDPVFPGLKNGEPGKMWRMRIVVDLLKCESNGLCVAQAPNFFALTDDDELLLLAEVVQAADVPAVEAAVRLCPKQALSLQPAG